VAGTVLPILVGAVSTALISSAVSRSKWRRSSTMPPPSAGHLATVAMVDLRSHCRKRSGPGCDGPERFRFPESKHPPVEGSGERATH
jgi:hypothetical protein